MVQMARPLRLTALASLLVTLACANTPEPGGGPPATSQAGHASAKRDSPEPAPPKAEHPTKLSARVPVARRVPVASAPADAQPCERMCGRVGDCLGERGDARDARHLELTCLDLCVNVEPGSDAGARFTACEARDSCDQLLECTRKEWDAVANARGTIVKVIGPSPSANYNTCELVCGGMYSCIYYDQPLRQLSERSPQFDKELSACVENCDPNAESMRALADCAYENTCAEQMDCWVRTQ